MTQEGQALPSPAPPETPLELDTTDLPNAEPGDGAEIKGEGSGDVNSTGQQEVRAEEAEGDKEDMAPSQEDTFTQQDDR